MDMKEIFKDFNPSKFVFFSCLLPLSVLASLKLEGIINWPMWVIFIPLWILNLMVIAGAIVGSAVWCRHPEYRVERDGYADYKAMLITVGMQLLLLMFELLLCDNIESGGRNMWILVFTPLFFASPVAVAACIWGFRHDRSLELEIILSVNVLLFIFVALRLDNIVVWAWTAVFIPLWILMFLPIAAVLYYFVWSIIFYRSTFPENDRKSHLVMAITWIFVVVPLLTFECLVAHKLDSVIGNRWTSVFIPLHISLLALIVSTFGSKGGNKWWFGIRTDFCQFVLDKCPCLRLYGNISYKFPAESERNGRPANGGHTMNTHIYGASKKHAPHVFASNKHGPVVVLDCIDMPD